MSVCVCVFVIILLTVWSLGVWEIQPVESKVWMQMKYNSSLYDKNQIENGLCMNPIQRC